MRGAPCKLEGNASSHWKTLTQVQDDECHLFNPEFDSTDREPYKKYVPNSRFFENPHGSLESEGEIDIPQMTSADSDSDSDSDSSDDDDEPGYRARSSTREIFFLMLLYESSQCSNVSNR